MTRLDVPGRKRPVEAGGIAHEETHRAGIVAPRLEQQVPALAPEAREGREHFQPKSKLYWTFLVCWFVIAMASTS